MTIYSKKFTAYTLALFICCSINTYAKDKPSIKSCEEQNDTNIMLSKCLDRVKQAVDHELNTWVNNQVFILEELAKATGRRSAISMFKKAQKNFETYRENNCRWHYLAISPGTGAAAAYKTCFIRLSKNRINELNQLALN